MAELDERKIFIRIVILCLLWYAISSTNNIIGKTLLNEFPFPMTVTMAQLISIAFYSGPVLKYMGIKPRKKTDLSWSYYKSMIIPLSIGKFVATLFSHISLWRVPVSYAHTVKATMPLFTVVITRILFREKQSLKIYFSLIPIVLGVAIATITEISFDVFGLASALGSTCGFALLTIFSKKVLNDTGIHHLRLLHLLGKLALGMFTPFWIFSDVGVLLNDRDWIEKRDPVITACLLFMDGFLNWVQNLIAFSILHLVTPLTYAVANTTKRICVITISLLVIGNPVTVANAFGMFLAVTGVFGYNKAKYDDNQAKMKSEKIPLSTVLSSVKNVPHPADAESLSKNSAEILAQYFPNPLQTAHFTDQISSGDSSHYGLPNGAINTRENITMNVHITSNKYNSLSSTV